MADLQGALSVARNIPALAATVTVVDDAGKVVTTSKTIFSAFKSAREAYKARKAEIASERNSDATRRREARRNSAHRAERRERRLLTATAEGSGEAADDSQRKKDKKRSKSSRKRRSSSSEGRDDDNEGSSRVVTRRGSSDTIETETTVYTPGAMAMMHNNASLLSLAPAAMLAGGDPLAETLQMLLMQLQNTIDELSCITAGIGALIAELQKVPDTLAVVGLTLAEISAIVAKISPSAIMGMKGAFPVIFGLLGSPQFAVVAGVGMAATVVVLGGFKIIKNLTGNVEKVEEEEEERDLDLEFGVTSLPDEIEEPGPTRAVVAPPPRAAITQLGDNFNNININNNNSEDKERRRTKRHDSGNIVKAVTSEKSLRSVVSDKSERGRAHKDRPKAERSESSRRHEKNGGSERREKREKSEKHERSEKHEKSDKHDRSDRSDRSDKYERNDKKKKEKDLPITPAPKFSLIRRVTAPASPTVSVPQRPSLSKRTTTASSSTSSSTSKSDEKLKTQKKKILGGILIGR